MSREAAFDRGRRLLQEGRLTVTAISARHVSAQVRGDSGVVHLLTADHRGWSCSCPAFRECAHLTAMRLVVLQPLPFDGPGPEGGEAAEPLPATQEPACACNHEQDDIGQCPSSDDEHRAQRDLLASAPIRHTEKALTSVHLPDPGVVGGVQRQQENEPEVRAIAMWVIGLRPLRAMDASSARELACDSPRSVRIPPLLPEQDRMTGVGPVLAPHPDQVSGLVYTFRHDSAEPRHPSSVPDP